MILFIGVTSCQAFKPKKVNTREVPVNAQERAKKNIEEGRGASIKNILDRRGATNFEFSSSNPMWRASLEILDFIPLNTVDYSGGMIISDWYTSDNSNESIKISIRFLTNEIRSDGIKIIVHKKKCTGDRNCKIALLSNSKISQELRSSILQKAAVLEKESKNKKKR
jgi:hypothetical protein